jgi:hypothetical protein
MTQVRDPATDRDAKLDHTSPAVATTPSKAAWWTGTIISAIVALWMGGLGAVFLFTNRAMVQEGMVKYGYPASAAVPILIVEIICAILYVIPRTAMLGAILLTGYLGGAVATHVHAREPWFFPVVFGVLVWLGLYLRDPRVRELAPLRKV